MEKLFAYGTLQTEQVQHDTFGRLLEGAPDYLVGYRLSKLTIDDPAVVASSHQAVHPIAHRTDDPRDQVAGMVFEITSAELIQSDAYEVDAYVRQSIILQSGVTAWVYVAVADH